MANLTKPQLGDVTAITITTSDLGKSLEYYAKLGFRELYSFDFPYPFAQITDGALLIMLRKDEITPMSLTYYVKDIVKVAEGLENKGIRFLKKPRDFDKIKRYFLQSPDQLDISLVEYIDGFYKPEGPSMVNLAESDYFNPEGYINKRLGMFGDLAHPVKNMEASLPFWENLGFRIVSRVTSPFPKVVISDGLAVVSLCQTSDFSQPAVSFFACDMQDRIKKLESEGLKGIKESKSIGGTVLVSPENQNIHLYQLNR